MSGRLAGKTPAVGGVWTVIGTATEDLLVNSSGRLVIDDNNSEDAGSSFASGQSGSLYAAFTLNLSSADLPSVGGDYFAAFRSGGSYQGRLFSYRPAGTGTGNYRLGIGGTGAVEAGWAVDLLADTDYRIVLGFSQNADLDVVSLWVDPTDFSSPSISTTPGAINATLSGFAFRQTTSTGDLALDDLVVGTAFGEVIPEPSSGILLAASAGLLGVARRRSSPLQAQGK